MKCHTHAVTLNPMGYTPRRASSGPHILPSLGQHISIATFWARLLSGAFPSLWVGPSTGRFVDEDGSLARPCPVEGDEGSLYIAAGVEYSDR